MFPHVPRVLAFQNQKLLEMTQGHGHAKISDAPEMQDERTVARFQSDKPFETAPRACNPISLIDADPLAVILEQHVIIRLFKNI